MMVPAGWKAEETSNNINLIEHCDLNDDLVSSEGGVDDAPMHDAGRDTYSNGAEGGKLLHELSMLDLDKTWIRFLNGSIKF